MPRRTVKGKTALPAFAAFVAVAAASACSGGSTTGPSGKTTIVLNVPARVFISQSSAMTATATRADRSVQDVTSLANWSSSNANIATVTPAGALQGVAGGTATITATYLGVSTTAAVQVFAGPALTVTIDGVPVQAAVTATESMETTGTYTGPFAFVTGTSTANRRVHVNYRLPSAPTTCAHRWPTSAYWIRPAGGAPRAFLRRGVARSRW